MIDIEHCTTADLDTPQRFISHLSIEIQDIFKRADEQYKKGFLETIRLAVGLGGYAEFLRLTSRCDNDRRQARQRSRDVFEIVNAINLGYYRGRFQAFHAINDAIPELPYYGPHTKPRRPAQWRQFKEDYLRSYLTQIEAWAQTGCDKFIEVPYLPEIIQDAIRV